MAILNRTIANLHNVGANIVTTETANQSSAVGGGLLFANMVDTTGALTTTSLTLNTVGGALATNVSNAAGLGVTLTDQEINTSGWFSNVGGTNTYKATIQFEAGQSDVDIDVYCALDNFAGQDDLTVTATGSNIVAQQLITNIGSNSDGSFFTLVGVTPDGADQIVLDFANTGGGNNFIVNGIVITPNGVSGGATLSSPTGSSTTTSITPSVSTSDITGGAIFAVVVPSGNAAPSTSQIIAGQDSTGTAAPSSNSSVSASPHTLPIISGLTANTAYDVYYMQVTAGGNSNVITLAISTLAVTTSITFEVVNEASGAIANTLCDYFITSAWAGTVLDVGQVATNGAGSATITGLNLAVGTYYLHTRIAATITIVSSFNVTAV